MVDFLLAARPEDRISDYPSISDLQQLMTLETIQQHTRLWEAPGDRLIAYAFLDAPNNLRFEISENGRTAELEAEVVAWGVSRLAGAVNPGEKPQSLDVVCRADDDATRAMLSRHGFEEHPVRTLILSRPLFHPVTPPILPQGFTIRPVTGVEEAPALLALHRAAHGTDHLTLEDRLSWMMAPDYDPRLDLLVVGPDGTLAAYCLVQVSEEENRQSGLAEGWTDPLATHPDYQRQGLATALLKQGLKILKSRGLKTARLATNSDNLAMLRTARKVGFVVEITKIWHSKPVRIE